MSLSEKTLIAEAISSPQSSLALTQSEWSAAVGQGHACTLLAKFGALLRSQGLMSEIPVSAARHIEGAEIVFRRQKQNVLYEIGNLSQALGSLDCPVLVLKGGAYIAAGLRAGDGRLVSDIDLMVPREFIGQAESALMLHGWIGMERDPYNQRYYREWMHEIPPMQHIRTGAVIDLHHTILPPTTAPHLDASKLFLASVPIPGQQRCRMLSPVDMVIHSAVHLFHEGDLGKGLRDLADIDCLIESFSQADSDFWPSLTARAIELGFARSLFYGLRYAKILLGVDVPASVFSSLSIAAPARLQQSFMDWLFLTGLRPNHPDCDGRWTPLVRSLLYVRGHWLRMPLHLLAVHLTRKWWMRRKLEKTAS